MKKYALLLMLILPMAFGHLEYGEDKAIGEYIVDLGYAPKKIMVNTPTTISLALVDSYSTAITETAWVRISNENVLFTGHFEPNDSNIVLFTYTFPKKGSYTIDVRLNDINTSFEVKAHSHHPYWLLLPLLCIVLFVWRWDT